MGVCYSYELDIFSKTEGHSGQRGQVRRSEASPITSILYVSRVPERGKGVKALKSVEESLRITNAGL